SSSSGIKLTYALPEAKGAVDRNNWRAHATQAESCAWSRHRVCAFITKWASRFAHAVALAETRAMAPPTWAMKTSHSGDGSVRTASRMTFIAASERSVKSWVFQ